MESGVVNVGADAFGNIIPVTNRLASLSEVLLFIANVVLCTW
jgi:hypothetical protein